MAQLGHSISQYFLEHYEKAKRWNNNFLISLSAENENSLQKLLDKLIDAGISVSYFVEPDIGNQLTSIAFEGTEISSKMVSSFPLSLKNLKN